MNLNDTLTHSYAINPNTFQQVYFIQNKDVHLAQQVYTVAQPVVAEIKSVSNSVKSFYENSVNFVAQSPTTQIIKRDNCNINVPQQYANIQKYVINPVPPLNVTQHIKPNIIKLQRVIKAPVVPDIQKTIKKVVPFEIAVPPLVKKIPRNGQSTNHTSVPLLRFGKQYHSVNKLTEEQKRLVGQALKNVPDNGTMEPVYDAASNTTITFKIVSPNDLKLLDNKKVVISTSAASTGDQASIVDKANMLETVSNKKKAKPKLKEVVKEDHDSAPEADPVPEPVVKVTRSGRTVRTPKHVDVENDAEESPTKHKKKHVTQSMKCFQCSNEFSSIIKLRRHYDSYPSHIPTANHTSLFQCLLSIVNGSKPDNRTDTFLQQLELLIAKLRSVLPCLLKVENVNGTFCRISEDVARLLDIDSGKYSIDINALSCTKDDNDTCEHNRTKPEETVSTTDINKPSQMWLTKHIEETAADQDSGICARTNSIEKWSPHVKRKWQYNPNKIENKNNKKRAVAKNQEGEHVNMAVDDDANLTCNITEQVTEQFTNTVTEEATQPHAQFQSAHFDVSYSPMKNQQSAVFKEFQLNINNLPQKFNGQFLQSSSFMDAMDQTAADNTLLGMLQELNSNTERNSNDLDTLKTDDNVRRDVFERPKDWIGVGPVTDQSQETYQPNVCIEPNKIHMSNTLSQHLNNNSLDATLIASDSCLSLPHDITSPCLSFHDSDLRNNSIDIGLDLFSFNNS